MSADYSITESIPVSDHVYKFLVKRIGSDGYVANRNDVIGNIVLSSLGRHPDIKKISKVKYSKLFHITIKEDNYLRSGVHLGVKNGHIFNNMIDKLFREQLYDHIIINNFEDGKKCVDEIRKYLKMYDITEDDLKLETLYRDFKRKKDEIQQRLISA